MSLDFWPVLTKNTNSLPTALRSWHVPKIAKDCQSHFQWIDEPCSTSISLAGWGEVSSILNWAVLSHHHVRNQSIWLMTMIGSQTFISTVTMKCFKHFCKKWINIHMIPSLKLAVRPWKLMVVRWSFPFGKVHLFRCYVSLFSGGYHIITFTLATLVLSNPPRPGRA